VIVEFTYGVFRSCFGVLSFDVPTPLIFSFTHLNAFLVLRLLFENDHSRINFYVLHFVSLKEEEEEAFKLVTHILRDNLVCIFLRHRHSLISICLPIPFLSDFLNQFSKEYLYYFLLSLICLFLFTPLFDIIVINGIVIMRALWLVRKL
jgi:hypothetical protein